MFRVVATEEACIDEDAANDAGRTEPDDAPVKAGCTPPAAFPAIHPLATIGVLIRNKDRRTRPEQILLGRKKVIIRHEHRPTQPLRRQIDQFSKFHISHKKAQKAQKEKSDQILIENILFDLQSCSAKVD